MLNLNFVLAALITNLALCAGYASAAESEPRGSNIGELSSAESASLLPESFAKNLVIINPIEIAKIDPTANDGGRSHFKTLLATLAGSNAATTFSDWAATWNQAQTRTDCADSDIATADLSVLCTSDTGPYRPYVMDTLKTAWSTGNIDLIAIVNRIDLAKFAVGSREIVDNQIGEFRLVYQLSKTEMQQGRGVTTPLHFNIIFEFKLPVPKGGDAINSLQEHAKAWVTLGALSGQAYSDKLATLVKTYAVADNLLRIRTDEALNSGVWEFRQFALTGSAILLKPLTNNPMSAFKDEDPTKENPAIYDYATTHTKDIIAGTHNFDGDPYWNATFGVASRTNVRWADRTHRRQSSAFKIIAANTCTGCHSEILSKEAVHIKRDDNMQVTMSNFLQQEVPVTVNGAAAFAMPRCLPKSDPAALPWCTESTWNEPLLRLLLLECFADFATCKTPTRNSNMIESLKKFDLNLFNYRYH